MICLIAHIELKLVSMRFAPMFFATRFKTKFKFPEKKILGVFFILGVDM